MFLVVLLVCNAFESKHREWKVVIALVNVLNAFVILFLFAWFIAGEIALLLNLLLNVNM